MFLSFFSFLFYFFQLHSKTCSYTLATAFFLLIEIRVKKKLNYCQLDIETWEYWNIILPKRQKREYRNVRIMAAKWFEHFIFLYPGTLSPIGQLVFEVLDDWEKIYLSSNRNLIFHAEITNYKYERFIDVDKFITKIAEDTLIFILPTFFDTQKNKIDQLIDDATKQSHTSTSSRGDNGVPSPILYPVEILIFYLSHSPLME